MGLRYRVTGDLAWWGAWVVGLGARVVGWGEPGSWDAGGMGGWDSGPVGLRRTGILKLTF